LRGQNYSITQISKILKLDRITVTKYINSKFKYNNSRKRISNLEPYYSFIEMNINKGIKMTYIYKSIKDKGYDGSYSTLRSYCRQFNKIYKQHPIIDTIYKVIIDFKSVLLETKNTLDFTKWLNKMKTQYIPELNSFVKGLERKEILKLYLRLFMKNITMV
jgi:predicted transcriptional regulator